MVLFEENEWNKVVKSIEEGGRKWRKEIKERNTKGKMKQRRKARRKDGKSKAEMKRKNTKKKLKNEEMEILRNW